MERLKWPSAENDALFVEASAANAAQSNAEAAAHSASDIEYNVNCNKPFIHNGGAYGCGHCVPCRIKKRREWTHRMMLEAAQYKENCFVTLTYSPDKLPLDMCVWPRELQTFLKRHRKVSEKFRFFGVGEYGDKSGLPHYHLALFGHPHCLYTQTRQTRNGVCCAVCEAVHKSWGKGFVFLGTLEKQSMAYVAGYINKKMTKATDPRLEGRAPEFARMSLKPGIGYGMMHDLASTLMEYNLHEKLTDVPVTLQHGPTQYPLGRYLRRSLRALIGRDKKTPQAALDEYKAKLHPVRSYAFAHSLSLQKEVLKASEGKRIQIQARAKLKRKKVTL